MLAQNIVVPTLILSAMGLLFGGILAIASKVFAVKADERIPLILDVLPMANCGGCGFAGCSAFAAAVAGGGAKTSGCPVGGSAVAQKVASIMGVVADIVVPRASFVRCAGETNVAPMRYDYVGIADCATANAIGGGAKMCRHGCMGLGTCARVCQFGAISIVSGIAVVDREKCTRCGVCVATCPKKLIVIIPKAAKYVVRCRSREKGAAVKNVCGVGCIACGICVKKCEYGAIAVENNIAAIDYDKCTNCGACADACPKKIIRTEE